MEPCILSTPDPEGYALLEVVVEVISLPVLDVISELEESAISSHQYFVLADLELPIKLDIHVVQESQVQLLANYILLSLLQMHQTTMIRFPQSPEEISADVICVALRCANGDLLPVLLHTISPIVLLWLLR